MGERTKCPDCRGITPPCCEATITRLRSELEQLRVQLAGCSVAAEGFVNTEHVANPGDYGWSPSYQDVVTIRRELELARAVCEAAGRIAHAETHGGPELAEWAREHMRREARLLLADALAAYKAHLGRYRD